MTHNEFQHRLETLAQEASISDDVEVKLLGSILYIVLSASFVSAKEVTELSCKCEEWGRRVLSRLESQGY
jgi:hypothetical protein